MKKILYYFTLLAFIFFTSCDDKGINLVDEKIEIPQFEVNDYNNSMSSFAQSVSKALKSSKEFRQIIKDENLKKFDGDFNVLVSQVLNNKISKTGQTIPELKKTGTNYLVKNLLEEFYIQKNNRINNQQRVNAEPSSSILDELIKEYPLLQIAMPAHAETWDCETIPVVAFIPSDFEEGVTEAVIGYDENGNTVAVDAITPTDYPVIVISQNERIQPFPLDPIVEIPSTPTNLAGAASTTGILLTWNYLGLNSNQIVIERNSGAGYQIIATVTANTRDYLDTSGLNYGSTYYYRIKAINDMGESDYSTPAIVVFINKPNMPANFEIINNWPGCMFLSWSNTITNSNETTIKIDRFIPGVSSAWQNIASLSVWENSYYDLNLGNYSYPTNRYQYRIYYDSGERGKSDAVFDVDYNSTRSPGQPLYITHIKIDDLGDIESWLQGAPDFMYTVATMNFSNDTPIKLKDKQLYRPDDRASEYNCNLQILGNWDKLFAQSVMSVNIVEDDVDGLSAKVNMTAEVKKAVKSKAVGDISIGAGGSVSMEFNTVDKNLGTEFVYYWEQINVIRTYGYGVKIRLSNQTSNNPVEWD